MIVLGIGNRGLRMVERNRFTTIIVTGVPGVGKTTVLGELEKIARKEEKNILVVNFGDYMFREAVKQKLVSHRDQMRHLPLRTQLSLQRLAAISIREDADKILDEDSTLIVDTHAVIKTSTGFWPGLPREVVLELKPDSIVLIEAPPSIILDRQKRDTSRVRKDIADEKLIEELILMARIAAMSSATFVAASVYTVENIEGDPGYAAKKILELSSMLKK